jgi:DMSO/TMAO reductase YedYZ molybdopterin-dependent catalytic subunit
VDDLVSDAAGRRGQPRLPPGQREIRDFPRFGLPRFARRFPRTVGALALEVGGDVERTITVSTEDLADLRRVEQVSDFHCVTTWTYRGARWSGFRFADFHERIVAARARPRDDATFVVFRAHDGYATSLPLEDLLAPGVLLADQLDGEPLSIAHGAPLRLVAPAHFGYKNAKHLAAIELRRDGRDYRPASYHFMDHPRARVAFEERGLLPALLLRHAYRLLIGRTIRMYSRALDELEREAPSR